MKQNTTEHFFEEPDMEVLEEDKLDSVAGGAALHARHSGKKTAIRSVGGGVQGPWRVMYKCTRCGATVEKYMDVTDAAMIPETYDF